MKLSGKQFSQLEQALVEAYPTKVKLSRLIRTAFDTSLQEITEGDNHRDRVFEVIEWAASKNYISKLIRWTHRQNPSNASVQKVCLSVATAFLKDVEDVEAPLVDKTADISTQAVQRLIDLVREESVPFAKVERAATAALPEGASDNSDDDDYADFKCADLLSDIRLYGFLRLCLIKYLKTPEGELRLLHFAQVLQQSLGGATGPTPLSAWIDQQTAGTADVPPQQSQRRRPNRLAGTLQVSLMVTIKLSAGATKEKPRYLVEGYLYFDRLIDPAQPGIELPPLQALSLPETDAQLGIDCAWAKVESYVVEYFKEANEQLARLQQELCFNTYELFIEIFLPSAKLGEPVDQWLCYMRSQRQDPLGTEHGVIVRISDRLDDGLSGLNTWKKSWARLQALLAPPNSVTSLDGHVEPVQDLSHYRTGRHLENALRKSFGLKLCCGLPKRTQEPVSLFDLFDAVFNSDTSLALWTRSCSLINPDNDSPLDISDELVPFLEVNGIQNLAQLAAKLTNIRQAARAEVGNDKEGQCLGDNLAFLLDNPDRLPLLSQY